MKPKVTRAGLFDMQVCVPEDFTDEQVLEFAESRNPSGTNKGWTIRREGDESLAGCPERCPYEEREHAVHIMLDA